MDMQTYAAVIAAVKKMPGTSIAEAVEAARRAEAAAETVEGQVIDVDGTALVIGGDN